MSSVRTPSRPSETPPPAPSVGEKLAGKSTKRLPAKQVRLKLVYIDFWSAVKFSFLISAAIGVVIFVAVLLVWTVLASTGIFASISQLGEEISGQSGFNLNNVVSFAQVMGFTLVIAALNIVVGTVLGAIACVLYNLSVKVSGGILVGFTNEH